MNTVARNQKIRCLCVRERESERDVKRDLCKKRPISHVKRDLCKKRPVSHVKRDLYHV